MIKLASDYDFLHCLGGLIVLLVFVQIFGQIFEKLRLPKVIGEITGGYFAGTQVLGNIFPKIFEQTIGAQTLQQLLAILYHLGLVFLMFSAGHDVQIVVNQKEKSSAIRIALVGTILPLVIGYWISHAYNYRDFIGINGTEQNFYFIFAIAMAITSIPVISKILIDAGLEKSAFARVILTAAVIEDGFLYIALSVLLSQARDLPHVIQIILITLLFFGLNIKFGPPLLRYVRGLRQDHFSKSNPLSFLLVFIMTTVLAGKLLGIEPMLSAFFAGIAYSMIEKDRNSAYEVTKRFSFAFFIPIYFAIVGLRLHFDSSFSWKFLLLFTIAGSFIKIFGVYIAALLSKMNLQNAMDTAITMNARGGPGIVLASLCYDRELINGNLFIGLILFSLITSVISGSWLNHAKKQGRIVTD